MKINEHTGRKSIELLGEILEPVADIMTDEKVKKSVEKKQPLLKTASVILKNHSGSVLEILAKLDNKTIEEYEKECNLMTLPSRLMELLNDKDLMSFFRFQGQMTDTENSGSVTENTEGTGKT